MNKGDIVTIYQKPITREDKEGKAELLSLYRSDDTGDGLEMWNVRFLDDDYLTVRTIYNS